MKYALPIFLISIVPLLGFSQLTDTTCIQSRWIALKPTTANKLLFSSESTNIFQVIKQLTQQEKLPIYKQDNKSRGTIPWREVYYLHEIRFRLLDTTEEEKDPYFEYLFQSDTPFLDEYGDPVITVNPDGTETFTYPHARREAYSIEDFNEIRLKEVRIYNTKTNQYIFQPIAISFYAGTDKVYGGRELFWVDLNQLFQVLDNKENYPWYTAIINKQYQGFQYMQTSCFDEEVKY